MYLTVTLIRTVCSLFPRLPSPCSRQFLLYGARLAFLINASQQAVKTSRFVRNASLGQYFTIVNISLYIFLRQRISVFRSITARYVSVLTYSSTYRVYIRAINTRSSTAQRRCFLVVFFASSTRYYALRSSQCLLKIQVVLSRSCRYSSNIGSSSLFNIARDASPISATARQRLAAVRLNRYRHNALDEAVRIVQV